MSNNRNIDKDEMYKKIMPSAQLREKQNEDANSSENNQDSIKIKEEPKSNPTYFKPKTLVNVAEHAVIKRRDEAVQRLKCCTCDRCIKDVTALAVNKLTPKYVVIYEEEIEKEVSKYHGDVVTALVNAIIIVKNNPRH
jgi:competence protein ComFB